MKTINKLTLISLLVTSSLVASNIELNSIGLNLGKSNSDYKQTNQQGSISLGDTPDESFNSLEVYTILDKKIYGMKPYISYTYAKNSELKHQYILTGLNKYYNHNKLDLYAGVLVGYGQLNWRYDPLNNSKDNNIDANSLIAGIQIGMDFPISKQLSLGVNGKYLVHDYETKLNPSTSINSTIEHKYTSFYGVGFTYKF